MIAICITHSCGSGDWVKPVPCWWSTSE